MKKLLFLFCFPFYLPAQSDFLKDPDIVWAAEIEQDWVVDIPSLEDEYDEGINTIKLLRTENNAYTWKSPYLADMVYQAALAGKLPIYKDPFFKVPADPANLFQEKDTVVTFDPETYEEKVRIVQHEVAPGKDFKYWRLRQILAYHKKSATWSTTVEAIAPMVAVRGLKGDTAAYYPLFWFKPENKRPKLSSNDVVWVKETRNKQDLTLINADKINPVKITPGFQSPVPHLFEVMRTNMKTPFYATWKEAVLSPEERAHLLSKSDTVVTFDPETYEEKVMVVENDINPSTVKKYRLVQTWYWDERRSRLSVCLDAVGLMQDVLTMEGEFRFSRPIFYREAKK